MEEEDDSSSNNMWVIVGVVVGVVLLVAAVAVAVYVRKERGRNAGATLSGNNELSKTAGRTTKTTSTDNPMMTSPGV